MEVFFENFPTGVTALNKDFNVLTRRESVPTLNTNNMSRLVMKNFFTLVQYFGLKMTFSVKIFFVQEENMTPFCPRPGRNSVSSLL